MPKIVGHNSDVVALEASKIAKPQRSLVSDLCEPFDPRASKYVGLCLSSYGVKVAYFRF